MAAILYPMKLYPVYHEISASTTVLFWLPYTKNTNSFVVGIANNFTDPQLCQFLLKIGTRSVHVGSRSNVSKDAQNDNCASLGIVTTCDRNFAGYAQTQPN